MSVQPHIQCDVGRDDGDWCMSIDYPPGGHTTATAVFETADEASTMTVWAVQHKYTPNRAQRRAEARAARRTK